MTSNHQNPIEISEPGSATLGLLYLMVDLEVLGAELQVADEAIGRQNSAYRDAVTDRLTRAGVQTKKVEDFGAWEETILGLISSNSRDKDHLAKIAAAEKAGLTLLEGLIDELKKRNQQERMTSNPMSNLAA
jgi:hypothetical protein